MKTARTKRIAAGLLTLVLTLSLLPAASAAGENAWAADIPAMLSAGPYAEGEVIAAVDPACADSFDLLVLMGLKDDLEGEDLMTVPEEEAARGEAVLTLISRPDKTTEELLYALAGDDRVVFAEPNYIQEAPEPVGEEDLTAALEEAAASISPAGTASLQGDPDADPADRWARVLSHDETPDLTPFQWGNQAVHVPGFGATGSNMEGDPVVVAVIDCPVDFSHPDLEPVAFTFTEEQQAELGCDEHGWSDTTEDGKLDLEGAVSHGTHVAGIIGGAWDGHGISGAASHVRIISLQVSVDGIFYLDAALRAFAFVDRANELGANIRITNNSWGGTASTLSLDAAVRALGEKWGTVSLFSAGNEARDLRDYGNNNTSLVSNPYAVLVAASTPAEELVSFSSYGGTLADLAAPGARILSAVMPEDSSYLPEIAGDGNCFLESFEGEGPRVTVVQENTEGAAAVTAEWALDGSRALALPLDQSKCFSEEGDLLYRLDLTLHDIAPDEVGNYLGLSLNAAGPAGLYGRKWLGIDEDPSDLPDADYTDGGFWVSYWMEAPREAAQQAGPADLTVRLWLFAAPDVDTVYFDVNGMGNEKLPYQYWAGTSMACPLAAGAAAVLASQTGKTGADLADLVKSTVRQTDALRDKLISGGVLDFEAPGNVPPERDPEPVRSLYDTQLPLDMSTGEDPFAYDAQGDWGTDGPLVGLGEKLYYLPRMTDEDSYGMLLAFNTKTGTWETLQSMPQTLYECSAAAFDGKLAVKGNTEMDWDEEGNEARVWIYDPAAASWSQASGEGALVRQSLFAAESGLALAGSGQSDPETEELAPAVLADYDPETGVTSERTLSDGYEFPQAVTKDGAVWLFYVDDYTLTKITAEGEEDLSDALPAYRAAHPDDYYSEDEITERQGILLACDEGLLLVGVLSEDGSADTWLLRDGADKFEPLLRKTCNTRPFFVAAEVLKGKVYAIGTVWNEESPRFFRANDLATLNEPIPAPAPGPSGGGGGAPASNPVNVSDSASGATAHGTVKSSAASARAGDKVTLTVTPDEGYVTAGVTVTDAKGNNVPVTKNPDGTWSFTMPAAAVTVTPEFVELPAPDPAPAGDVSDRFADVSRNAWYHDAVQWAVDCGLMNGVSDTLFAPNDPCTRAMVVTMLWRLAGEPAAQSSAPFADVKDGAWYAGAVAWAAETGAVNGTSADTFSPNEPVTREQLAAILYRYAQAQGKGFEGAWMFLLDYSDADQVSEYANEAMHWMVMHGVITGMGDGTLAPRDNATRAQIAMMFMRFCVELEQ